MTSTYEAAQMSGPQYPSQNGTPPSQPHMSESELQKLQENIQKLRDGGDVMHLGNAPPQYSHLAQMAPAMNAHQHQPQHPHFATPTRPAHSPQQMAHAVMSLEGGHHDPYDAHDASRKRSKVSRACDECRRKKIRCDATSENGPEACSSCKRTGARCQFSRQPMKRGPSKGYIKELADRLHSLENKIHEPASSSSNFDYAGMADPSFAPTQSPPPFSRKRTHSMTDDFHEAFSRPHGSGQDREPSTKGDRRSSFAEASLLGSLVTSSNEEMLTAYADVVHPTLPALSPDASALNRLTHCPSKLREAFFLSLEGSIRSFAPKALPETDLSPNELLHRCFAAVDAAKYTLHDADNSRQLYNNIVYCQSLILLVVASDRPGTAIGSTAQLLGQIAGCITESGLNDSRTLDLLREQDQEAYSAARRVFWTAYILDRLHASSRSKDVMLPLHSGSLSRDEYTALGGDVGYHLARAAEILGQIVVVTRAGTVPHINPSSAFAAFAPRAASPQAIYLEGQLNGFRESIEITTLTSTSPPYLAYQYLRLYVARLSPHTASFTELLDLTQILLGKLIVGPITPLHHIFANLVATSFTELSDRTETQLEAYASIKEMSDALSNGQILCPSSDGLGWDTAIRDMLQKRAPTPPNTHPENSQPNMAGLRHLAAAAVGERESVDVRPSTPHKLEPDTSAAMAAANEAARAQATAAAAQEQLPGSPNGNAHASSGITKAWAG